VLAPFAEATGGLYYQATRRTEAEQLAAVSRRAGELLGDPALTEGRGFRDWPSALRYFARKAADRRFLLVLDEYPYLEGASPGLASVLQAAWDHDLRETRLKLVLAGSHVSAMARLEAADQPLHARRTARVVFRPFPYFDAAAFLPGYGPRECLRAYSVFGGVPGNLALVDSSESLSANVVEHILDPTSRLFDEAEHLLDAFLGDAQVHYSVLQAVARGENTWSGITKRIGRSSGSVSRPVHWLLDMGYLRRDVPITERDPSRSKRALYRLDDPYLAFWHRFVGPLVRGGVPATLRPELIWERHVEPGLGRHLGPVFEEVCRDYLRHSTSLPFVPDRVGGWWTHDTTEEIDAVALGENELLVAECKWGGVTAGDLRTLQRRGLQLANELGGSPRVHHALFSASERVDEAVEREAAEGRVLLIGVGDLFEGLARYLGR
jgi:AAA+ ATPase superfamily predicted ATPase